MKTHNSHKIYEVRQFRSESGDQVFRVFAADSWLDSVLGIWVEYCKSNSTLEEAIEQIDFLKSLTLIGHGNVVFRVRANELVVKKKNKRPKRSNN